MGSIHRKDHLQTGNSYQDFLSAIQDLFSKGYIFFVVPDLPKTLSFQIAKLVDRIFIKATRNYQSIPGNDCGVPQPPAVVGKAIL